jgi:hypothetical protein
MCQRRFSGRISSKAHLFVMAALTLPAASTAQTKTPDNVSLNEALTTRPCSANPVLAPRSSKKGAHKPKHPLPAEPLPACLEVKGEGIEVQEFLQTTAREETWRIGENRASEDAWSFVRYFGPDELEKYADTKVLLEPVNFTSGKAAVLVRTTDIGDGYSRVQVSVHFQGEGRTTDKTWGQPSSVWPLNSKGVLEQEVLSAVQTRFKPLQ